MNLHIYMRTHAGKHRKLFTMKTEQKETIHVLGSANREREAQKTIGDEVRTL